MNVYPNEKSYRNRVPIPSFCVDLGYIGFSVECINEINKNMMVVFFGMKVENLRCIDHYKQAPSTAAVSHNGISI